MTDQGTTNRRELSSVRSGRAHLWRSSLDLEAALATPLAGRPEAWREQVAATLAQLRASFDKHIEITESDQGLFGQIKDDAPWLGPGLTRLHREHDEICAGLASAAERLGPTDQAALEEAREVLTELLGKLSRHRQRGADLLYEAYEVDIGGE